MENSSIEHSHELHMDPVTEYNSSKLGIWLFLATEVLLFGGLFAAYSIFRAKYPDLFYEQHLILDRTLGSINTVVLICSSLTMALGVTAIKKGNQRLTVIMLLLTIILGAVFGVNKYFEYTAKFHHGIYPSTNMFFYMYFMMTGLHMLHVFIGMVILSFVLYFTARGKYSKEYNTHVEVSGLYWHLVDLIWIYLFPLLYLIA